jgi:hypothetical protein
VLPCTSHTIRFFVPRVNRGVGLAGVQERDWSSFAAISASSLDCSKTFAISLSSLAFSLAFFFSSFLRIPYRPFESLFVFVRACSDLGSFVSVCLTLLLLLGRHCHFTCDHLPSADDSIQSNLEISKLLVNSVQHPG